MAVLVAALSGPVLAAPASTPPAAALSADRSAAPAACERAALDTLRTTRGAAAIASFSAPPTLAPGPADSAELTLRGSGQARIANGTRPFSYSCTFDSATKTVTGLVLRDSASTGVTPEAARSVEPDLTQISPAACESAAASSLKRRWPGVANILFNADTRRLSQQDGGNASLRGQGTAIPALRDPTTHFAYDCTVDPRNGRIVAVRITD
jgi:hypothetical protein